MNFWDRTAPAGSEQPLSLGEQYRAWQRNKAGGNGASGSMLYSLPTLPEQKAAAAQKPSIYVPREQKPLQDYMGKERDPLDRRASESTEAWRRRVVAVGRALDENELAARLAKIDEADEQERLKDHDQLRAQLGARTTGEGIGVMGLPPGQRAAALDTRRSGDPRIPASMSQVRATIQAKELAQRGQPVEHTDLSGMASSGEGWMTR